MYYSNCAIQLIRLYIKHSAQSQQAVFYRGQTQTNIHCVHWQYPGHGFCVVHWTLWSHQLVFISVGGSLSFIHVQFEIHVKQEDCVDYDLFVQFGFHVKAGRLWAWLEAITFPHTSISHPLFIRWQHCSLFHHSLQSEKCTHTKYKKKHRKKKSRGITFWHCALTT